MLFHKKRTDGKFYPAKLEKDAVGFPNPCRGWYRIYTFCPEQQDEEELRWLPMEETETLVLVRLNIGAFRQRELDEKTLGFVEKIFGRFIQAGKDMILRILYDTEGKGMEKEPPFLDMVLTHMRQLGPVIAKYADAIYLSQGLFVGNWGEMHGSKFLSPEQIRLLEQTWRNATEGKVAVAFRKMSFCRMVSEKGKERQIGLYDDAILASETHLGTFAEKTADGQALDNQAVVLRGWEQDWSKEEELAYLERTAPWIPVGGEVVARTISGQGGTPTDGEAVAPACGVTPAGGEISEQGVLPVDEKTRTRESKFHALSGQEVTDTLRELESMRVSYLNCIYDDRLLTRWEQTKVTENRNESLYEVIGARLGYCFWVEKAVQVRGKAHPQIRLSIRNEGFANLTERAILQLEVRKGKQTLKRITVEYDMRTLMSNGTESLLVKLPEDMPEGEVWLCMTLERGKKTVRFANKGAENGLYLGRWEK